MFPSKIPSSTVVKNTVNASFKGKRFLVTLVSLCSVFAFYMFSMLIGAISSINGAIFTAPVVAVYLAAILFIVLPVTLGVVRFFWRLTGGAEDKPTEVFYYFSSATLYKRAVKTVLLIAFKCVCCFIICLLPYLIVNVLSHSWIYQFLGTEVPVWVAGLALVEAFLKVTGIFAASLMALRYYLVPCIVAMDDDLLLFEAVHISVMVSKRSLGSFGVLVVSLLGWAVLSLFVIPVIYTAPLFFGCYVVHSRYALVNYNLSLDFYNNENKNMVY